ncbi:MAG: ATP-binding protein [Candidatus Methanoplasma sp.]|nr:ATP-binding protein [Candidatus Methanoplasma sp.]
MKQIPIGIQDFKVIREGDKYFVDKSMLIGRILKSNDRGVYLYTRPRRFGKSVNLSMIDAFLNLEYKGNRWFDGLEISSHSEFDGYRNAFPVISIDFKDLNLGCRENFLASMGERIRRAYRPFSYLEGSEKTDRRDREIYASIAGSEAGEVDLENSLAMLSDMLRAHHGAPAVILVDEYDSPMQGAYGTEVQGDVTRFMRTLLSSALKGSGSLQLAVVTGVLQMAKESIFSGLNNLKVNNILSADFDEMYGFTEPEVRRICDEYGRPDKFEEAREWYDGYRFGNAEIYNPWSILSYADSGFRPAPYWANTSGNSIIADLLSRSDQETLDNLGLLGSGESFATGVKAHVTYSDLGDDAGAIYSMMAVSGYLKAVPEGALHRLSIPNAELYSVFADLVSRHAASDAVADGLRALAYAVSEGDQDSMCECIGSLLSRVVSSRVLDSEHAYQAFLVGALMHLSGRYEVKADYENGDGYYDIMLRRKRGSGPNIVIEIKRSAGRGAESLREAAEAALRQIKDKRYAHGLDGPTLAYGVAFHGKTPCIASERLDAPGSGLRGVSL